MTTSVAVVIGHGGRNPRRRRNLTWVSARYETLGYPVTVGTCRGTWCKATAINPAAAAADVDVLVIADGDCVVDPSALASAVTWAAADGYAQPANTVHRLTADATDQVLAMPPDAALTTRLPLEGKHQLLAGGGVVAVHRDLWADAGGFDPRFTGWGGEDFALGCALYALTGVYPRAAAEVLHHLWHPPQTRDQRLTPANEALSRQYLNAKHNPPAMRSLLAEWQEARHADH